MNQDILSQAALDCFKQLGYKKVFVRDICMRASISPTTFYKSFKNKNELIIHLLSNESEKIRNTFLKQKKKGTPWQTLLTLIEEKERLIAHFGEFFMTELLSTDSQEILDFFKQNHEENTKHAKAIYLSLKKTAHFRNNVTFELFTFYLEQASRLFANDQYISLIPDPKLRLQEAIRFCFFGLLKGECLDEHQN